MLPDTDANGPTKWSVIEEALSLVQLELRDVDADGNCLLRALADQMWKNDSKHAQIRQAAVAVLNGDLESFSVLAELGDGESMESYAARMGIDGEYADNAVLHAAAIAYDRNVVVVMAHGVDFYRVATLRSTSSADLSPPLWVAYHDLHYRSVRGADGGASIPLTLIEDIDEQLKVMAVAIDGESGSEFAMSDCESEFDGDDSPADDDEEDDDNSADKSAEIHFPHLPHTCLTGAGRAILTAAQTTALRKEFDAHYDLTLASRATGFGWRNIMQGQSLFASEGDARDAFFDAFLKYGNPGLLAFLVRGLGGGPSPSAAELASIGGYAQDSTLAYIKIALRKNNAPDDVPDVVYVGHTSQSDRRQAQHRADTAELTEKNIFGRKFKAHSRWYHLRFVGAVVFHNHGGHSNEQRKRRTVLAHFTEGLLMQWLGTVDGSKQRQALCLRPVEELTYAAGNSHTSFFEHPRSTTPMTQEELLTARFARNIRWWAEMPLEARKARQQRARDRLNARTDEQKRADAERQHAKCSAAWAAMSREEKEAAYESGRKWYAGISEATRQKKLGQMKARNANLSEEAKAERNRRLRERRAAETPEKRAKRLAASRANNKALRAKKKAEAAVTAAASKQTKMTEFFK